jgi:MFS family permease
MAAQEKTMSWYSELNQTEKRTFFAAFTGWALDGLDFLIFTFVVSTLISIWHIDRTQAGMLATVTLLVSAIGGWLAGILADRFGRARVLQGTILWFSICTLLIGFAQNFSQIFVLRALQGLGFGGEWAVGSVLMGEMVKSHNRGKIVGTVQSAWAIGWGGSAILYTVIFSLFRETMAWRVLFWMGVLPALLVFYIRKNVPEPELFAKARQQVQAGKQKLSAWAIFSPRFLKTTVLASLLCTGAQGGYYGISIWLPTFLKTKWHLSVLGTGSYLMVVIVGSFIGYIVGAYLTDILGRRANFITFAVLSGISIIVYTQLTLTDTQVLILGFPIGFASCGLFSGMGPFLTELFPSSIRATGQGFSYSFGRAFGALFPTLVGYLSQRVGLGPAIGIFAGGAYVLVFTAAILLPETRGTELASLEDWASADQAKATTPGA